MLVYRSTATLYTWQCCKSSTASSTPTNHPCPRRVIIPALSTKPLRDGSLIFTKPRLHLFVATPYQPDSYRGDLDVFAVPKHFGANDLSPSFQFLTNQSNRAHFVGCRLSARHQYASRLSVGLSVPSMDYLGGWGFCLGPRELCSLLGLNVLAMIRA
jgi:hypothetical protein